MNAMLNIQVMVNSAQATAEFKSLQTQVASLQKQQAAGGAAAGGIAGGLSSGLNSLQKFGKNLQWTGRQLVYNFTLPLTLAGAAAGKWAMQNETAMTTIRKVYGAFDGDAQQVNDELKALETSFTLLSERFGVHKDEVLQIGAAWAQAGAQGVALAKATRLTLETMVLGQQDSTQATEELLTIQSAYRLNTDQLRDALVTLNAVQVSTAVDFGGLVDAVSRAGGIAVTSGVDIRHLAAFIAALVPASGTAAAAGNGLRTILSRIMAPTKQAAEEMAMFGINVNDASWQMLNGTQRIELMATKFNELSDAQQNLVSATVASRWQINRFDILMHDIASNTGAYAKALETSGDQTRAQFVYAKQLSEVLASTPKAFQILITIIQNSMAKIILPVLPAIIDILKHIAKAVEWFSNLSPRIQELALGFLFLLAVIGPITQLFGAVVTLVSLLGEVLVGAGEELGGLIGFLVDIGDIIFSWPVLIAAALAALGALFREQILTLVQWVIDAFHMIPKSITDSIGAMVKWVLNAFNLLPQGVQDAFIAVVKVIEAIMVKVKDALSHLNPFARHSPSLVDNVQAGVATILDEYKTLQKIPGIIQVAVAAQKQFDAVVKDSANQLDKAQFDLEKMQIAGVVGPSAIPAVDAMVNSILQMKDALELVNEQLKEQAKLVDDMQRQIDSDMKPYNDAIFANEEAQKKLRLEIMKMEDAGQTIDAIKDKMSKLAGEIESLKGVREDLRLAGAGSDVLKSYDAQIAALEKQQQALQGQQDPIQKLQDELDKLQRKGEELNLEKDIKFDPQLKALDEQKAKLDELSSAYSDMQNMINDMEQALSGWAQKAQTAAKASADAASAAQQQFDAASGANFPDVAGSTIPGLGREGGLPDIQDFNDKLQKELDDALNNMGNIDLFKPLRDKWDELWAWTAEHVAPKVQPVIDGIVGAFQKGVKNEDLAKLWDGFVEGLKKINEVISNSPISGFWDGIKDLVSTVAPIFVVAFLGIKEVVLNVWKWIQEASDKIRPELEKWAPMFDKAKEAILHIMNYLGFIMQVIAAAIKDVLFVIVAAWQVAWPILASIVKPIFDSIVDIIRSGLEIVRGIIMFVLDIINGDWGHAWDDIVTIIGGVWDTIYNIFAGAIGSVLSLIQGVVEGVVRFFQWLYDTLVGHSIIPDMMKAIVYWFNFITTPIKAVINAILWVVTNILIPAFLWAADMAIKAFNALWTGVQWAWDNIGSPIFDAVMWVIQNVLIPAFQMAWDMIKYIWDALMIDIQLAWDNILSPIFDGIKWAIENVVIPAFQFAWDIIKTIWAGLMVDLQWAWDHILSPIFDGIKWAIENIVIPAFNLAKTIAGAAFDALGTGIQFVWDHVISPIFEGMKTGIQFIADKFSWFKDTFLKPLWDGITMIFQAGWDGAKGVLETGLNILVNAFNFLSDGINGITDFLHLGKPMPRLDPVKLAQGGEVPKGGSVKAFAAGGTMPFGVPFIANIPTAIVGEGNSSYNEYVIPTDPKYRKRALDLYASLGTQLLDAGDIIGDIPIVGGVASWIKDFYDNINSAIHSINSVGFDVLKSAGAFVKDKVIDWGKDKIGSAIGGFASAVADAGKKIVDPFDIGKHLGLPIQAGGIFTGATVIANAIPALGAGGIVLPSPGGTVARLAERGHVETVLPYDARRTMGHTENHFYGDFIFPNVKDGKDAKAFFDNLKKVS